MIGRRNLCRLPTHPGSPDASRSGTTPGSTPSLPRGGASGGIDVMTERPIDWKLLAWLVAANTIGAIAGLVLEAISK
jgi:hypothetical protein